MGCISVHKPPEEWYRVENTHEAIISEDIFRQVQNQIDIRKRAQRNGETQLFAGLVKCADCGWSMGYNTKKLTNSAYGYYHCSKNGQGLRQCSMHYVRYEVLYAYVLSRIQFWTQKAQRNSGDIVEHVLSAGDKEHSATKQKLGLELARLEKRKAVVDDLFVKIYEDWSSKRITDSNFNMLSGKYQAEQCELDQKIKSMTEAVKTSTQEESNVEKWMRLAQEYVHPSELTRELLNTLIEKIVVHEAIKGDDGVREQEIEIYYRFIGKIE